MKPKSISGLVFKVVDLDKTLKFYESLGFRIDKNDGRMATAYINWFFVEFHVANDIEEDFKTGPHVMISVAVDDFYQGVLDAGYQPESELQETVSGRREFALRDPNGYLLVFFEKK